MSEVQRQTVYIAVASASIHQQSRHRALDIIGQHLSEMGFVVDMLVPTHEASVETTPVNIIFSEHQLQTPFRIDPRVEPGALHVRPGIADTVISMNHPLQISVIGAASTGKTFLCNVMSKVLEVPSPMFLSLDRVHLPHDQLPEDGLQRLKDRTQIKIVEKTLITSCRLDYILLSRHYTDKEIA